VKAYFGWDSVSRMEIEYQSSVARWFHLFSHHQPMDVGSLLEQLRSNQPAFVDASHTFERGALSPLDVFSLPFRHLCRSETMEELSLDYGIRYCCNAVCTKKAVPITHRFSSVTRLSLLLSFGRLTTFAGVNPQANYCTGQRSRSWRCYPCHERRAAFFWPTLRS